MHRKISTQGDDTCIYEENTFRADPLKINKPQAPMVMSGSAIVEND